MTVGKADILLIAEDPGAANYLVHLPEAFRQKGFSCLFVCDGAAAAFFESRGIASVPASTWSSAGEILDRVHPRLVVAGTSENTESLGLRLIQEGRERGVSTVGIVDAFTNAPFRFRGTGSDPLQYAPEWLVVPDRFTGTEFESLGFTWERIAICGHPQYDHVRDRAQALEEKGKAQLRRRYLPPAAAKRPVILFVAEQPGGLNPEQYLRSDAFTLRGRGGNSRNEVVLEEFLDAVALLEQRPFLVLRVPPKATKDDFSGYVSGFDFVSRQESALEMVFACDGAVGMTSTLLLEAVLLGRPTFSILPREIERGWLSTIRSGHTVCATRRDELRKRLGPFLLVASTFSPPNLSEYFVFGAAERVVSLVQRILG